MPIVVYGDEAGFAAYAEQRGWTLPSGDVPSALLRGSMVVDRYEPRFSGQRVDWQQDRAWPRTGASTYYGNSIPSDAVPQTIINASYEAAFLELTNPGSLSPVVTGTSTVKREKIGQLEVEYASSTATDVADMLAMATPVVTAIEGLLWPFLCPVLPGVAVV